MCQERTDREGKDPTIRGTGHAVIGKDQHCNWYTTDGSTSICTIQNPSRQNTLTILVSGAPQSLKTADGKRTFNGRHEIPPNSPDVSVTVYGNLEGKVVDVFNMSALETPCAIHTEVPPADAGSALPSSEDEQRVGGGSSSPL